MIVAIDIGNTRIKWGVRRKEEAAHPGVWDDYGTLSTAQAEELEKVVAHWPQKARVVLCNVAGPKVVATVETLLAARGLQPHWLAATESACGIRNSYHDPRQLGADRWAALIGARSLDIGACLVVCAGTATTIDYLDSGGVFHGGMILPGLGLMRAALASGTAQLTLMEGSPELPPEPHGVWPKNTHDAIERGCIAAQTGAIEHLRRGLPEEATLVLSGGAASRLMPHLNVPARLVEKLALEGLFHFARALA